VSQYAYNADMNKSTACRLLGGTPTKLAEAIGINSQAYYAWPDELPRRIADRVVAAIARRHLGEDVLIALAEKRMAEAEAQQAAQS
jgi:hypothetical protein